MNVLFLCMDMEGLHGSFIHIMEYAEYFKSKGWNVTIGSVFIADVNRRLAEERGFKVCPLTKFPATEFDLVYALHLLLFPALVYKGLKYKKAISMSLSSFMEVEQLPPLQFLPQFDLIGAISREAVDESSRKYGLNPGIYTIIPNCIPLSFLSKSAQKQSWNKQIRKICVVTNHNVKELIALPEFVDFDIDYFGSKFNTARLITPELLLNYDAIITIGKTVQYGLGLGIPVYEYDQYGGCGYITPDNIAAEEEYNFSGRKTKRKLTARQIAEELVSGYSAAIANAPVLRKLALKRYAIDTLIEKQLTEINKSNQPRPKLKGEALAFANASLAALQYIFRGLLSSQ
ncbi:MAG: hypothetical protein K2H64_02365 [Desulfovibrio sp.]|nr:hypothetical protein [Desulfovibrio sp.]